MHKKIKLEDEITSLLASFQSVFFGINESTVLSELDQKMGAYDRAEAVRFFLLYRPLVQELFSEIDKYQRPSVAGEILSEDSFDVKRLANDVTDRRSGADPVHLEKIARQIVYWRYLR